MGIRRGTSRSGRRVYRVAPGTRAVPSRQAGREGGSGGGEQARRSAGLLIGSLLAVGLATVQLGRLALSSWRLVLAGPAVADPTATDTLVSAVTASVAAVLAGWLLAGVLLTCLEIGAGPTSRAGRAAGRCARRVAPAVLRHGVAALLGVTLGVGTLSAAGPAGAAVAPLNSVAGNTSAGVAAPTAAAPVSSVAPAPRPGPAATGLSPGWTPTRPQARHTATTPSPTPLASNRATRPQARAELGDEVVVRRGDTLWALAARQLGRDASDAQIALEWPTWFAANRKTIGDDPDLLHPGLRLRVPEQGGAR